MKLTEFEPFIRDYWRSQRQRGLAGPGLRAAAAKEKARSKA